MSIQRPVARYRQVADALRREIAEGAYAPGATLPSQPSLAQKYGLNQTTISRAMAVLEAEGLVRTEQGRGSYVIEVPTVKRIRRIPQRDRGSGSSFAESVRKVGLTPRTELIQAEVIDPPAVIANYLGLAEDSQTLIRKRHMFADERPVQLAASYIPLDIAGSASLAFPDTGPTGIYRRLAERGYRVVRFTEEIESRRPSPDEADFFRLSSAHHVLQVVRFAYSQAGRPLEVVSNIFPSRLWRLTYEWEAED